MKAIMIIFLLILFMIMCWMAGAEESEKYILCNPKPTNHVAIRRSPRKGAEETGRLDCGDSFWTDGKTKNGYLHILGYTEDGEGWVHLGYVVDDPPIIEKCNATVAATGRVMSWRRVNSGKNGWLKVCDQLKVYARSEDWAVTNKGYVRMKYLEVWYDN